MSQDTLISSHKTVYPMTGYLSNRSTDVHWTETALLVPLNEALLGFPVYTESLCSHTPQELFSSAGISKGDSFLIQSNNIYVPLLWPQPINSFAHSQVHKEKLCSSGQNLRTQNYSNALTT